MRNRNSSISYFSQEVDESGEPGYYPLLFFFQTNVFNTMVVNIMHCYSDLDIEIKLKTINSYTCTCITMCAHAHMCMHKQINYNLFITA